MTRPTTLDTLVMPTISELAPATFPKAAVLERLVAPLISL